MFLAYHKLIQFKKLIILLNHNWHNIYVLYVVCGGRLLAHRNMEHLYSHAKYGDQNYDNKADCDWIVQGLNDQRVKLRFLTFEVEHEQDCGYDYVEVYDGEDDSAKSFGKFCGNKVTIFIHLEKRKLVITSKYAFFYCIILTVFQEFKKYLNNLSQPFSYMPNLRRRVFHFYAYFDLVLKLFKVITHILKTIFN